MIRASLTQISDGNIRYFEYQNDKFEYLSEYKSADPQRGLAFLPKRGVNVHENEVMRAFKTVNDAYIEPISFIVPRRAEVFQDDIYPPTVGSKAAVSVSGYFEGKTVLPPKLDLASVYAGQQPTELAADYKAPTRTSPESNNPSSSETKTPEPHPEHSQPSSSLKGPPPSMNQQTASIKNLASKYNDDDDDEEADGGDSSSFEEIAKPIDRSAHQATSTATATSVATQPASSEPKLQTRTPGSSLSPVKNKPDDFEIASQTAASTTTTDQIKAQQEPLGMSTTEPIAEQLPPSSGRKATEAGPVVGGKMEGDGGAEVKQSLAEIKSLLEEQKRTMSAQNDTIGRLTQEVDRLRSKMGES